MCYSTVGSLSLKRIESDLFQCAVFKEQGRICHREGTIRFLDYLSEWNSFTCELLTSNDRVDGKPSSQSFDCHLTCGIFSCSSAGRFRSADNENYTHYFFFGEEFSEGIALTLTRIFISAKVWFFLPPGTGIKRYVARDWRSLKRRWRNSCFGCVDGIKIFERLWSVGRVREKGCNNRDLWCINEIYG